MSEVDWKNLRMLIVEDEDVLRDAIQALFQKKGCHVFSAENGRKAFAVVEKEKIDFVVSDVRMPDGDGLELLSKLRERNPDLPLVLLATGFADLTEEEAIKRGAVALIHKPFRGAKLVQQVESFLIAHSFRLKSS